LYKKERRSDEDNKFIDYLRYLRNNGARKRLSETQRSSSQKLTLAQVEEIRKAPVYYGSGADLAKKYGVSQSTISSIRRGKHYSKPIDIGRHRRRYLQLVAEGKIDSKTQRFIVHVDKLTNSKTPIEKKLDPVLDHLLRNPFHHQEEPQQ